MNLQALKQIVWNSQQKRSYKILKFASIIIGNLFAIFDIYIGFLLGIEKYWLAIPLIGASIIFAIVNDFAWSYVLEQMGKEKVIFGRKIAKKNKKV